MDIKNMKNIVVLKNLPSNMIEEAFVILKDNVKVHKEQLAGKNKENNNSIKKDNDFVVKEAEMIVSDYVNQFEEKKISATREKLKLEEKCKKLRFLSVCLSLFSVFCVISILLR